MPGPRKPAAPWRSSPPLPSLPVTSLPSSSSPPPSPPLCPHLSALRTPGPSSRLGYTHLPVPTLDGGIFPPVITPPSPLHKTHTPPLPWGRSASALSSPLYCRLVAPPSSWNNPSETSLKALLDAPLRAHGRSGECSVSCRHVRSCCPSTLRGAQSAPLSEVSAPPPRTASLSSGGPSPGTQASSSRAHSSHAAWCHRLISSAQTCPAAPAPSRRRVKSPRFPLLLFFAPAASLFVLLGSVPRAGQRMKGTESTAIGDRDRLRAPSPRNHAPFYLSQWCQRCHRYFQK